MTLDDLAKVFAATSMEVREGYLCITRLLSGQYNQGDADFVAIAVAHWPKLLAVAEAAKALDEARDATCEALDRGTSDTISYREWLALDCAYTEARDRLKAALAALEKP